MVNRKGENGNSDRLLFSWAPKSLWTVNFSQEIKRHLLLERKNMANLDSILKIRDLTSPAKFHIAKVMGFPVVKNRCKSWSIKNAEYQRIDAFELYCWSLESLGLQGDQTSQSSRKLTLSVHWKDYC